MLYVYRGFTFFISVEDSSTKGENVQLRGRNYLGEKFLRRINDSGGESWKELKVKC